MADPSGFSVRPAKSSDEVFDLWWPHMQSLGWNRARNDHATHWHSSGGDYLVLTHAPPSPSAPPAQPIGVVLPVAHANRTGWIGFFVVDAAHRGGGGGALLLRAALDALARRGVGRVGLDAVLQQVPTYVRRGFVEAGRVKLCVTGRIEEMTVPAEIAEEVRAPARLRALGEVEPARVVAADERATGLRRTALWTDELLVRRKDAWGFAVEAEEGGEVLGFVLVRGCQDGYRVGPLYAARREWAKALLFEVMKKIKELGSAVEGKSLVAEVWGENPEAVKVFEELGWEYSGIDYARMWLDGKATEAQKKGGVAEKEVFAWFDAGEG
ncbi:hypothetical protein SLS56_004666 [Neofusicoccum ribis]|uniref:N-acetyltransferase domain-containing protein n=1 Tax=Neofusicoccum ribis TaxID=45134 RepID=A0ABR3SWG5_9PEZI